MENQNDRELRAEKANLVKELISELNEYKKIGEPEELAKMKERYTPKKPLKGGDHTAIICYICPQCCQTVGIFGDTENVFKYCPDCGQKIDWSEERLRQGKENQKGEIIMDEKGYVVREIGDRAKVAAIRAALKANDGYCPCQLDKSVATRCMCHEFLSGLINPEFYGPCRCGLYIKEKKEESK